MAPIIEQQDPFTAALGAVAGYLTQKRQNTNEAQDRALQQQQVNAQIADAAARRQMAQQQMDLDTKRFGLEQTQAGIDPNTGQPFNYGHSEAELGSPKNSLEHKAIIADQMAADANGKGATAASARYTAIANGLRQQAHQANADALAFRKEIDAEITHKAQREHWSAQDQLRAKQIANQYEIGIRNGDIRLDAANIAASAHLQGISMEQRGAMQRTQYAQGQENQRARINRSAAAAAAAARFNANAQNQAARTNASNTGGSYKPVLLPASGSQSGSPKGTITQADAIRAGATKGWNAQESVQRAKAAGYTVTP